MDPKPVEGCTWPLGQGLEILVLEQHAGLTLFKLALDYNSKLLEIV